MENPFDYILTEREEHERKLQFKREDEELTRSHQKSNHQDRVDEKQRYDGFVVEVLEQLRQAAYPSLKVHCDEVGWSIGMWVKRIDGGLDWYSALDVRLEHDLNSRAVRFECSRHHHRVYAEPSREDLIKALQQIFPPLQEREPNRSKSRRK